MDTATTFKTKSGTEITIRPACPGDCEAIVQTLKSSALERSYVLMEQYGMTPDGERAFLQSLDREKNLMIVALDKEEVVGSLAGLQADNGRRPQSSHILEIGIHLHEHSRGQGIGSRMLDYAEQWAREHGYKKLVADIFTLNKRSLDVFLRVGYEQECLRKNQVRIGREYVDEVCMGKIIVDA